MKTKLPLLFLSLLILAAAVFPASAFPASAADPVPLGNPVNLQWAPDDPGVVTWETEEPYQGLCRLAFYQEDGSKLWSAEVEHDAGDAGPFRESYFKYQALAGLDLSSGSYTFTVQNLGDGTAYSDSAEAVSGVYAYEDPGPGTALDTPTAGRWDWPAPVWDDRQDTDPNVDGYLIEYGWNETEAASPDEIKSAGTTARLRSGKGDPFFEEMVLSSCGPGWYYFRVRPVSANIETHRCGDWSGWSQGYHQDALGALDAILNDPSLSDDDLRYAVQALGQEELKTALTADVPETGTGTADTLAALEARLGGPAKTQVDPALQDRFDQSRVSIVGAALNDVTGTPVLNIGKPGADHVLDAAYDSTLAVHFSMTLDNTATPHDLAVPVKVTLPIPDGVNPDFLAILHYRADGTFEEALHTVFQKEDGQWYASFVLTGFSDFTLTEAVREEPPAGNFTASVTIDGAAAYYETFAEAWKAATDLNVNTHAADAAITLLKDAADESTGTGFYLNHGQTVTLNLSGHTLTLSPRRFFIDPGTTLILNGAPEDGGENGKIIQLATDGEPGVVDISSGYGDDPLGSLQVNRCDLESHNGPAIFGGDGNVELSGCTVTAQAVVSDLNRRAAVAVGPNPEKAVTLKISGSTLSGQCGLSIGPGVTATVEDSKILGTGEDMSDYGVWNDGGSLTVKGNSSIEAPVTGVDLTGGTLDFQSGVIRASSSDPNVIISGVSVKNNASGDTLPVPEATIRGTVESGGYGVRAAGGTVRIQDGASVTGKSEGVFLDGGRVLISGGSVTASGVDEDNSAYPYGTGLSALRGAAEISGSAQITGVTNGIYVYEGADASTVTVTGGTAQATGENGVGLRVYGGSVTLKGGTFIGTNSAVETAYGQILVKELLAGGCAYYRPDGSVITAAEMDQMQTWFPDITQVTVKEGSPGVSDLTVTQTGPGTVRIDPRELEAILPASGKAPAVFAAIAGSGRAAAGEVDTNAGEITFKEALRPGGRLFFLDPDTFIPLAKSFTVGS